MDKITGENALLIIDAQYDFCHPNGALYVEGANADMERLSSWIRDNSSKIDHISLTLDNHPVNDISHPSFWMDKEGNFPSPFTPITAKDIHDDKWIPRFFWREAIQYVESLEKQGEFGHFIWPFHCLIGSRGAALDDNIMKALMEWSRMGKFYQAITKGTNPLTEHFGVFRANIPIAKAPETQLNHSLINTLKRYRNIFLAGEAKSHCIANSLKQAMEDAPSLAKRIIILEDCMSDVWGMGHLASPIFAKADKMGIRFTSSKEVTL